ncbi:hypothetical protein K469DRAFT_211643 [Zopfia rhizophila CBS 207.26]|uniref:Secreted protein n=1 Tax=Zopfia rhizophila CBS 207.26 TaxID=1314779 RepID=A0A6A6DXC3_9PEZI|nr:hypothetical protein K469DRAFT_211643 [Zopfia rhizophila CBS 207.26]
MTPTQTSHLMNRPLVLLYSLLVIASTQVVCVEPWGTYSARIVFTSLSNILACRKDSSQGFFNFMVDSGDGKCGWSRRIQSLDSGLNSEW